MRLVFVILLCCSSYAFAQSEYEKHKKFYDDRYQYVKNYRDELTQLRKKNINYKGAIVETVTGSFFTIYGLLSQSQVDQKALALCNKNKGKKCKVRFQSFKINPHYHRYAEFNSSKQTLEGADYVLKVNYLLKHKNILFLKNIQNHSGSGFVCTQNTSHDPEINNIFINEINKYPSDFIQKSGLKFIVICNDLKVEGSSLLGMAPAHYDKSPGVFFVNRKKIKEAFKKKLSKVVRHTFHHEFFHIIDCTLTTAISDSAWEQINQYPYRNQSVASNLKLLTDRKGFITNYASNNAAEDKAEVFANLINDYSSVKQILKNDKILFQKVQLLIQRLKKISPTINADFWRKL